MHRRPSAWSAASLCVLMACSPSKDESPTAEPQPTSPTEPAPLERFREAMQSANNDVRDGLMIFATYEGCCDGDAQCLGNNPATPYGTYAIPTLPNEAPAEDILAPWGDISDPALTRSVHLRGDEAIVFIGTAPPEAAYFSMRSYQLARTDDNGTLIPTLGSLGESLNHLTIAADRGVPVSEIWGEPLVVITTADRDVEDMIRGALESAGFDPASIHHDRMTASVLNMGLDESSDLFTALWRTALPVDRVAEQAFRDAPGSLLLRITPQTPLVLSNPQPTPNFTEPGSGTNEDAWSDALVDLGTAINAAYPESTGVLRASTSVFQDTLDCIGSSTRCGGDIRDRLLAVIEPFTLDGDEFVVAFGVNHTRAGKTTYSNLAVTEAIHSIGLLGFNSDEMVGSARPYLPNEPLIDDLYALTIARDCTGRVGTCLEVAEGCPGVDPGGVMRIINRAYLEPSTGVAPAAIELLPDAAIKFFPTPAL